MIGKDTMAPKEIKQYLKNKTREAKIYCICHAFEGDCEFFPITKKALLELISTYYNSEIIAHIDGDGDLIIG